MTLNKVLLFFLILALLSGCTDKKKKSSPDIFIPVKAEKVQLQEEPEYLQFSGNILPYKTVKFGFMVAGKVKAVHVVEGEYVKEGKLIAEIDPTDYNLALDAAQAQFHDASKEYERLKKLYDKGSLTPADFDKITTMYKEAKADYEYKLKQVKDTRCYAPDDGYIAVEGIEPGEILPQGYPVFGLVHTEKVFAEASVPESEIDLIKMGTEIKVNIPALNDTIYKGKISRIGQVADPYARAFPVKATVQNPGFILKPGMIATIKIPTGKQEKSVTIAANSVVIDANGQTYVYVINNDLVSKKHILTAGINKDEVIVERGLKGGDMIVTEGRNKLYEGAKVKILN